MSNPGIPLGGTGKIALVDDEDYERAIRHRWSLAFRGYAHTRVGLCGPNKHLLLHRFIVGALPGEMIDHANRNKLDNRRTNLRRCNRSENSANRGPLKNRQYKGAYPNSHGFYARIQVQGKLLYLGAFQCMEDAAHAYDDAALKHFGEFACLNFPDRRSA